MIRSWDNSLPGREGEAKLLFPLDDFYSASGTVLPDARRIDAERMPQPQQQLLDHGNDMTPTLEDYHGEEMTLKVLAREERDNVLAREVVLMGVDSGKPAEFGAIRIHLRHFEDKAVRELVRQCKVPFGRILGMYNVPHVSWPQVFFEVKPDKTIQEAFGLRADAMLYGRQNVLLTAEGEVLAEVVEVLPPLNVPPVDGKAMDMIKPNESNALDAIVIGAGPAGSTAAALLAEKGRRVVMVEKDKFPRYHVGESLIPFCYFTLNRLGMVEKLNACHFTKKYSVQFVKPDGSLSAPFYFHKHKDHPSSQSWQVLRSEFDQMLAENAVGKGATLMEQTAAKELIEEDGKVVGVRIKQADGEMAELRAPITIDATGRDMFAINRYDWKVRDPQLNKISIWTYYKGAKRDEGIDAGATTVAYIPEKGWFWYIPLHDDVVSVGVVADREYLYRGPRDPKAIFEREIQNNEWIRSHLAEGEPMGEYWVTGDYSYRSKYCAKDGLVLTGDAFAFLDPVFSSGVFLALKTGEMVADVVDEALSEGDVSAARFSEYGDQVRDGIEGMRKLVYAFYEDGFSFKEVLMKYPELRGPLTDCLIGDVFRDLDELWEGVQEFTDLPEALPHGKPLIEQGAGSGKVGAEA